MEAHVNSVKQGVYQALGNEGGVQKHVSLNQQQLERFYYNLTPVQRENIFSIVEAEI